MFGGEEEAVTAEEEEEMEKEMEMEKGNDSLTYQDNEEEWEEGGHFQNDDLCIYLYHLIHSLSVSHLKNKKHC